MLLLPELVLCFWYHWFDLANLVAEAEMVARVVEVAYRRLMDSPQQASATDGGLFARSHRHFFWFSTSKIWASTVCFLHFLFPLRRFMARSDTNLIWLGTAEGQKKSGSSAMQIMVSILVVVIFGTLLYCIYCWRWRRRNGSRHHSVILMLQTYGIRHVGCWLMLRLNAYQLWDELRWRIYGTYRAPTCLSWIYPQYKQQQITSPRTINWEKADLARFTEYVSEHLLSVYLLIDANSRVSWWLFAPSTIYLPGSAFRWTGSRC